jgi:hypothetical protein
LDSLEGASSARTLAMTTKTIPAYLEDERQKGRDTQLRVEEEAARIQPLNHGHHRTAKQPKLELPSAVEAAPKVRKTAAAVRKSHAPHKTRRRKPTRRRDSEANGFDLGWAKYHQLWILEGSILLSLGWPVEQSRVSPASLSQKTLYSSWRGDHQYFLATQK